MDNLPSPVVHAELSPSVHAQQARQATAMAEAILASPKSSSDMLLHKPMSELKISGLKQRIETVSESPLNEEDGEVEDDDQNEACNLFIGDLARNLNEDQLREPFTRWGEVVQCEIKRDKVTGNNLGYGFVVYRTPEQAEIAKEHMDGQMIGNRAIRIGWAQKNTTLFVGDLDGSVTTDALRNAFREYGPIIEEETFVKPGGAFGFVRFQKRNDAERAKAEMNRKNIGNTTIRVGWGDNNHQKHCVNVQFNPALVQHDTLSEAHIRDLFARFGTIVAVNLPRYSDGRLKGYAFVHFRENGEGEKSATAAITEMNGRDLILNVSMRCGFGKKRSKQKFAGSNRGRKFGGRSYSSTFNFMPNHNRRPNHSNDMRHPQQQNVFGTWVMHMGQGYPVPVSPAHMSGMAPYSPHLNLPLSPVASQSGFFLPPVSPQAQSQQPSVQSLSQSQSNNSINSLTMPQNPPIRSLSSSVGSLQGNGPQNPPPRSLSNQHPSSMPPQYQLPQQPLGVSALASPQNHPSQGHHGEASPTAMYLPMHPYYPQFFFPSVPRSPSNSMSGHFSSPPGPGPRLHPSQMQQQQQQQHQQGPPQQQQQQQGQQPQQQQQQPPQQRQFQPMQNNHQQQQQQQMYPSRPWGRSNNGLRHNGGGDHGPSDNSSSGNTAPSSKQ